MCSLVTRAVQWGPVSWRCDLWLWVQVGNCIHPGCWMSHYGQADLSQPVTDLNHPPSAVAKSTPLPHGKPIHGSASFLMLLELAHPELELVFPLSLALPTSASLLWLSVLSWKPQPALLGLVLMFWVVQAAVSVMSSSCECRQSPNYCLHAPLPLGFCWLSPLPPGLPPLPPLHPHLDPDLGFQAVLVPDLSLIQSFWCLAYKFV